MKVTVEKITPQIAATLLGFNTNNYRSKDPKRIAMYAEEMRRGNWHSNGDSIVFDSSGVLTNGQHRLHAIVKSGCTIECVIVRGAEGDGRYNDTGKARTIGQWCTKQGIKNGNAVAAIARMAVAYKNGKWGSQDNSTDALKSEVYEYITTHTAELEDCAQLCRKACKLIPASIIGPVVFIGCKEKTPSSVAMAVWFIDSLVEGQNLTDADPVYHFRNKLLAQTETRKLSIFVKRCLATIAWNKTVRGDSCTASQMRITLTGPSKQSPPSVIYTVDEEDEQ